MFLLVITAYVNSWRIALDCLQSFFSAFFSFFVCFCYTR